MNYFMVMPFHTLPTFPKFLNRGEKKYSKNIQPQYYFFKFVLSAFYARFAFCASVLGSRKYMTKHLIS